MVAANETEVGGIHISGNAEGRYSRRIRFQRESQQVVEGGNGIGEIALSRLSDVDFGFWLVQPFA